ncbi:MAG TPA: RIP metalloprotease RseP [Vicinamibacterales bacterium]
MTTLVSFIFVLGVLIFVHELGHFLMARRIGVRVLTFSLGFGPKILAFRRGDTEYCISVIPLGGYVKMAGETVEDDRTGASDEFLSKTKWQRFQVLVMGPVMNLALAVVLLAIVISQGAYAPAFDLDPVVVDAVVDRSPAAVAGLTRGDRILAVDGAAVATWEQLADAIARQKTAQIEILVERNRLTEQKRVVRSADAERPNDIGVRPKMRPQILSVTPGDPAAHAGLEAMDVIVAADGEASPSYDRVRAIIAAHEDRPFAIEVERSGSRVALNVTPRRIGDAPRVGASISPFEVRTFYPGAIGAFTMSVQRNWEGSVAILQTLGRVVTGQTSVRQLAGPVGIAGQTGAAAAQGWTALLSLMALISLNLGLLNLMPVPVLDGGHIAILALEGVSRRDFSIAVKEKMLLVGFALLVLLMATVIYNDLTRIAWIQKALPWK